MIEAITGLVVGFVAGLLVGRKNPSVADKAAEQTRRALDRINQR